MVLAFAAILLGLAAIIPPLQRNRFYLLNSALVIGAAWLAETHFFRINNIWTYKTLLLFLAFHIVSINFTTFIAYGVDKKAAVRGSWRIPEKDLHMLEFLGGWIGAAFAQRFFHHKTVKKSYRLMYKMMIVMEFAALWVILKLLKLI